METASLYIELADGSNRSYNGTRNYPEASYSIDGAYDGQQFAELNCKAGALYQDVLTAPGTTLHWSLAHRARGRGMQDSMALLIAPVDVAAQITDILAGVSSEDDNRGLLVRAALDGPCNTTVRRSPSAASWSAVRSPTATTSGASTAATTRSGRGGMSAGSSSWRCPAARGPARGQPAG